MNELSKRAPVACFGEMLLRMSPKGGARLRDAVQFGVHVGGAEANVAVALTNLGQPTRMLTTLPDNALGELAIKSLRAEGVDTSRIARRTGRMGSYFFSAAAGPHSGELVYDRVNSAFALAEPMDANVLDGVRHLHVSGISLAVSEQAARATLSLARAAKERDITISFDGNFRPSLWAASGRDPRPIIAELLHLADLFFGNHKDVALLLERDFSGDGSARRREAALAAFEAFPSLSRIASTARQVDGGTTHRLVGRIDGREGSHESGERVLTAIVDRIGTGDAFAAGVLAGWLEAPDDLAKAVEGGMALTALKHYEPGDFCRASNAEWSAAHEGATDVAR